MMDLLIVWTGRHNSDNFSCSVKFSIKKIKLLQLLCNCFPYRSVSTGRLSEQPVRITLGGQTYQGSTDSLNMERPMDTGQSVHCSAISFILEFYFCVSSDMNLQSNQQRLFFFFWSPCRSKRAGADWFSKSTDGPLHRGLAAQQQHSPYVQSSGHTAPHDIRWGTAFFSIGALICVIYLILNAQMLFIPQWAPTVQPAHCVPPAAGSTLALLLVWPSARPLLGGLLAATPFPEMRERPAACAMSPTGRPLPAWRDSSRSRPRNSQRRHSWRWAKATHLSWALHIQ